MRWIPAAIMALGTSVSAHAKVQVAFIEFYNSDGRLIQLEPGGRFAHVAVSHKGLWLHAHPLRGVELTNTFELSKLGRIGRVVELRQMSELSDELVRKFLGKPYDPDFTWSDDKIYCSELIAKIFGLPPEPMHFDTTLWPQRYWKFEGQPGLSPDKVFAYMTRLVR